MTRQKKTLMLGGLMGLWATAAVVQMGHLPELREAPLTYTSGQRATKIVKLNGLDDDIVELRPIRVVTAHLPSTPKRNIFEPAGGPAVEKRVAKISASKKQDPPPTPVPVIAPVPVMPPPPPMPSPEELAERAARQQQELKLRQLRESMAQYRYLGYLTRDGEQKAFLGKGQEIYIIHLGETLDGQFQVAAITSTAVKILAAQANVEATLQLKTDSPAEPS